MRIKTDHKDWSQHQFKGLVDGPKFMLQCKMCDAPLVEVWVTIPNDNIKTELIAKCPHCGSQSFKRDAKGAFHLGHTDYTTMIDFNYHEDLVTILTAKGDKKWTQ